MFSNYRQYWDLTKPKVVALIVFFLVVEPHGLARLWSIAKEKLRLWPFPH